MRPGQQQNNKRMRGRNRKGPNPMARVYESNGPDVKIRGTAAHVADKYGSLARDASVSGDPVAAENYLQHAEHYYRIIAAAQAVPQNQPYTNQFSPRDDDSRDDDEMESNDRFSPPAFFNRAPQNEQGYNQRPNGAEGRSEMNGTPHGGEARNGGPQPHVEAAPAGEAPASAPEDGERQDAAFADEGQGPRRGRRRGRYRRKDEGEGGGDAGESTPGNDAA